MPAALLPSFGVSEPKDFYSGGSAGQVEGTQARWVQSAKGLEEEQAHLAGIDLSGYIRPEGEVLAGMARICLRKNGDGCVNLVFNNSSPWW